MPDLHRSVSISRCLVRRTDREAFPGASAPNRLAPMEFWTEKTSGGTTMHAFTQTASISTKGLWAGRLISGVAVMFLIFDGVTKLIKVPQVVEATAQLGFPQSSIPVMGVLLLACTLIPLRG